MNNTELSIQINLGGFSFSLRSSLTRAEIYASVVEGYDFSVVEQIACPHTIDRVTVYHNTHCTTIVPCEIFATDSATTYLEALNLIGVDDIALYSFCQDKAVVWAANKHLYQTVQAAWPQAVWDHPACEILRRAEPCAINILLSHGVANIAIFDSQELFAVRSTRFAAAEDLLYFVRQMATCDTYNIYKINLLGDIHPDTVELFASYYANVQLECNPLFLVRL